MRGENNPNFKHGLSDGPYQRDLIQNLPDELRAVAMSMANKRNISDLTEEIAVNHALLAQSLSEVSLTGKAFEEILRLETKAVAGCNAIQKLFDPSQVKTNNWDAVIETVGAAHELVASARSSRAVDNRLETARKLKLAKVEIDLETKRAVPVEDVTRVLDGILNTVVPMLEPDERETLRRRLVGLSIRSFGDRLDSPESSEPAELPAG